MIWGLETIKRERRADETLEIPNIHELLSENGGLSLLKFQILEQEISIDELAKRREQCKRMETTSKERDRK